MKSSLYCRLTMQHLKKILASRAGFSLLEMALVVSIIGLLTGAIVAGKSYIHNAKLNTATNEARYYIGALQQFEQRYGAVAGDMPNANSYWTGVTNGDGNGLIVWGTGYNAEYFLVFQHLAKAGLITGSYTGSSGPASSYDAIPGTNVPAGAIDESGYLFGDISPSIVSGDTYYFDGYYIHPLFWGRRTSGNILANGPLSPLDAEKVDAKYDDGNPGLGWIRTYKGSVNGSCVTGDTAASASYIISNSIGACRLFLTLQ